MLRKIPKRFSNLVNLFRIHLSAIPRKYHLKIPYFTQFPNNWEDSGASNKNEFDYWTKDLCGTACLQMVLRHKLNKEIPLIVLGKSIANNKGYILGNPKIKGLFHEPFAEFVNKHFALKAKVYYYLTLKA